MKILLLGAGGLLGRHLHQRLQEIDIAFLPLRHADLDICDRKASLKALDLHQPSVVINAAALCNFGACEDDPSASSSINREAPIWWAETCGRAGVRFIQFSSDYIFDGTSVRAYREDDLPNPLGQYGRDKAALEAAIHSLPHCLVLRISWLFGAGGKTFLSMIPELLMQRDELTVAAGKRGTCLHAGYAADVVIQLLNTTASGVLNLAQSGETSWEEFADNALEILRSRGMQPRCRKIIRKSFREIPSLVGNRPEYSPLDTSRLATILKAPVQPWYEALEQYISDLGDMRK